MSGPAQFGEIPAGSPIPQEHDDDEADAPFGQAEDPGLNGQEPLDMALGDCETVNDEEGRGHDPHRRSATSCPLQKRYGFVMPVFDADVRVIITIAPTSFVAVDGGLTQKELHDLTDLING